MPRSRNNGHKPGPRRLETPPGLPPHPGTAPVTLWPNNVQLVGNLSRITGLPPEVIANRFLELAASECYAQGIKNIFADACMVAGGVMPDPREAAAAEDDGDEEKPDEGDAATGTPEERLRWQRILAGVEFLACGGCASKQTSIVPIRIGPEQPDQGDPEIVTGVVCLACDKTDQLDDLGRFVREIRARRADEPTL